MKIERGPDDRPVKNNQGPIGDPFALCTLTLNPAKNNLEFFGLRTLIAGMRNPPDLLERTKTFAIDVLKLCATFPTSAEVGQIKRQLLRAATVGANYQAARRGRSRRDFVAKLSIVEEEADECVYELDCPGHAPGCASHQSPGSEPRSRRTGRHRGGRQKDRPAERPLRKFEVQSGDPFGVRRSHFELKPSQS